jgi:hypothetical protein
LNRNLKLKTCRDEPDSPEAFRRLKVIRQMVVACVRRRKFANGRLVRLVVTPMGRSVTIYVAIAFIAAGNRA